MNNDSVINPDVAELAGRLQAMTQRAVKAEAEAVDFEKLWKAQITLRVEMMSQLVGHGLPIPLKLKTHEPLRIESQAGQLRLVVPNGLVFFEDGLAVERVIMQLIEQAREAFPETFAEVF